MVRTNLRCFAASCLALALVSKSARADTPPDFTLRATVQNCTLTWNGLLRNYMIYIPSSYDGGQKAIWMTLHGSQSNGSEFLPWTALSDQEGFILLIPAATPSPVNYGIWQFHGTDIFPYPGAPRGTDYMWTSNGAALPDDMGFLRNLLALVQGGANSDPSRIYAAGFSVGGCMAHRVGVELSDVLAAVAIFEGVTMTTDVDMSFSPPAKAPVSIIAFHEWTAFIEGNVATNQLPGYSWASYDMFFNYWSGPQANNCATTTSSTFTDAPYNGNLTGTMTRTATGGLNGTEVACYALQGGGHAMYGNTPMNDPTASPYNPSCGEPLPGISENEMVVKFFNAHPKSSGSGTGQGPSGGGGGHRGGGCGSVGLDFLWPLALYRLLKRRIW